MLASANTEVWLPAPLVPPTMGSWLPADPSSGTCSLSSLSRDLLLFDPVPPNVTRPVGLLVLVEPVCRLGKRGLIEGAFVQMIPIT